MLDSKVGRVFVALLKEPRDGNEEIVSRFVDRRVRRKPWRLADGDQIRIFKQNTFRCQLEFLVVGGSIPKQLSGIDVSFDLYSRTEVYGRAADRRSVQCHGSSHDQLPDLCL